MTGTLYSETTLSPQSLVSKPKPFVASPRCALGAWDADATLATDLPNFGPEADSS